MKEGALQGISARSTTKRCRGMHKECAQKMSAPFAIQPLQLKFGRFLAEWF